MRGQAKSTRIGDIPVNYPNHEAFLGFARNMVTADAGPYLAPAACVDSLDVYDVTLANGAVQCGIFVTPDGKIASVWVRPAAAPMPAAR